MSCAAFAGVRRTWNSWPVTGRSTFTSRHSPPPGQSKVVALAGMKSGCCRVRQEMLPGPPPVERTFRGLLHRVPEIGGGEL